jgi:hypothetical protein
VATSTPVGDSTVERQPAGGAVHRPADQAADLAGASLEHRDGAESQLAAGGGGDRPFPDARQRIVVGFGEDESDGGQALALQAFESPVEPVRDGTHW